jgi:hypothetical protein
MFMLQSYTMKIVIKILFTILLTNKKIIYFTYKYLAWLIKIYFTYWHCNAWRCWWYYGQKLLTHCGSAESVFKTQQLAAIDGVGTNLLKNVKDQSVWKANKELEFIKANSVKVAHFQDEDYPERLKHCIDGPVLLFSSGNIDLKKND